MIANNPLNRKILAEWIVTQIGEDDLMLNAVRYLMAFWAGKFTPIEHADQAFENDLEAWGRDDIRAKMTDGPDPKRQAEYRCADCKSEKVKGQFWVSMNWPFEQESNPNFDLHFCQDCHDRRKDGIIRYLEKRDPVTGKWEIA